MFAVREFKKADLYQISSLEMAVWGETGATECQILSRHNFCPEGSIVIENDTGKLVAYAAAQRVDSLSTGSWGDQTDNGTIASTHKPNGPIAYGVNMSALPEAAKLGAAQIIIGHYRHIFIESGACCALALGSRAPGFAKWKSKHNKATIHEYLDESRNGLSIDPELRLYQKNGFRIGWPLQGYFDDPDSLNHGVMISSW